MDNGIFVILIIYTTNTILLNINLFFINKRLTNIENNIKHYINTAPPSYDSITSNYNILRFINQNWFS